MTIKDPPLHQSKPAHFSSHSHPDGGIGAPTSTLRPYVWMLSGCLAFSIMATMVHVLSRTCDWRVITVARTGLALVFATILAGRAPFRAEVWKNRTLWMRSIAGSLSLVGTFYAYSRVHVSDVLTLTNVFPVWVALLSWPVLGIRPSKIVWLSVGVSFVGVMLIQHAHADFATVIALASSFCTAIAMIGLHRLSGINARAIVVHFSFVSLLFCIASLFVFDQPTQWIGATDTPTLAMLLGIGVAATIGQLFLTKAFAAGPPAQVSVVGLSQIPLAMSLETIFLGRSYELVTLAGMALVLLPTAWLILHREAPTGPASADVPLTAEECDAATLPAQQPGR